MHGTGSRNHSHEISLSKHIKTMCLKTKPLMLKKCWTAWRFPRCWTGCGYIYYRIPTPNPRRQTTSNNINQPSPLLPAHLANHKHSWIPPFGQPHVWPDICSIPDWSLVDPSSELQLLLPPSARGSRWQDLATPSSTWAARSRHATKTKRDVGSPNQWQNADALSPWRGFMVLGERRVWQGTWGPLKGIDISKISKKQMASVYCITWY